MFFVGGVVVECFLTIIGFWSFLVMTSPSSQQDNMDSYLSQSIEGLRSSVEKGFDRIERRIEGTVSREAFTAEVNRLDQRDNHLEASMAQGFSQIKLEMAEGFKALELRDRERDLEAEKRNELRDKKFGQRFTWMLTILGIAWAVAQFWLAPLIQR